MKKLSIVILKFNGEEEVFRCLSSLQFIKLPKNWQKEIIIVDNSIKKNKNFNLKFKNLKIKTILNNKNVGFAKGVNIGIKEALENNSEAILLLNQDTQPDKDFLFWLLNNHADIVGSIIKFRRGGKWVYDYGGKVDWKKGKASHIEKSKILNLKFEIDYVSGCCMLIHRPVFEKIGFFDERYFLYFEDVDFCLRAKKAGFKITVEPKSVVTHFLKEGKRKPLWQRWQMIKSNLIFINRWIDWWRRPLAWIFCLERGIKILIK
ncbi:MAG: glycosyltransferase family 2 protein [Microgenomates group bacterium]